MTAGDKETEEVQVIKLPKLSGMTTIKAGAVFFFLTVLGNF